MFFSCCGVIFAVSRPSGTPRGPSFLRAISSSVGRSSSRVSRGISHSHADANSRLRVLGLMNGLSEPQPFAALPSCTHVRVRPPEREDRKGAAAFRHFEPGAILSLYTIAHSESMADMPNSYATGFVTIKRSSKLAQSEAVALPIGIPGAMPDADRSIRIRPEIIEAIGCII
jgi:hypothetical protein